ncbi:MAG: hypothetical protein NO516_06000 [Candidatus Methanomethylicia archaeon]|nr:hypothetical protein [Candidatus Methanomethylicia archaeon]
MRFLTTGICESCGLRVEGTNCLAVEEFVCESCGKASVICKSCQKVRCPHCSGILTKAWPCEYKPPAITRTRISETKRFGRGQRRSAYQR